MKSILGFLKRLTFPLLVILMLVVFIFAINMRLKITSDYISRPLIQATILNCVPTPLPPPTQIGPNTSTPSILGLKPVIGPSVTTLPVSKTIDQAPNIADNDKYYVYVWRCNGTIELYKLSQDTKIESAITLKSGDVILFWVPAALSMGHQPPTYVAPMATPFTTNHTAYPPSDSNATPSGDLVKTQGYPPPVVFGTTSLEVTSIIGNTPGGNEQYPGPIMGPTFTPYPSPTLKPGPTTTPFPLRLPAKDASGDVIYFESNQSGVITAVDILPVDATGYPKSEPLQINTNLKLCSYGVFPSPDGYKLAIIGPWKAASIYQIQTGKIEPFSSYFNIDQFYGWYPDNQQVLVRFEGQGLWLVDPTGKDKTPLAVPGYGELYGAAASPDGKKVVYTYQNETWMVNADGRDAYKLSPQIDSVGLFSWSPDGSKIAFAGNGWMVMDADGSNLHTVGKHGLAQDYMMPPLWSPDSQTLVVVASNFPGSFSENSEQNIFKGTNIFLIDVKTGEERLLLNDQSTGNIDPTWSPDGSKIAFISNRGGSVEVWVVNIDGSELHAITADSQLKRFPSWHKP